MAKLKSVWSVLCVLVFTSCGLGFREYSIEEVSQALYDEGLICSKELSLIEYPTGIKTYPLRRVLCFDDLYDGEYGGNIDLYPTRSELRRVTRAFAVTMSKGPFTYSQFVEGNVVITINPALSEEDAQRFRRALESLE